ncbi:DUF3302 domain-containing protein [Ruficoccus amylovorans]|uniref:DUF3302 domain-containing protein n=1 Tax=Ruficoccus amylovorans TaxID=1804625 RepID=A0A842HE04_9BACT|nr:DUF3302 domain-containing protein [Ruficoccus amylovorans]MBC2594469.1 DUF3302 domain-containing protein [Ruficoccus amylovorans]
MTTLEKVANVAALIILIMIPIMAIALFWMVHILPEKIAHRKNHPQKEAIKVLVLMSLLFGGMLWPIAWVWTFLKSPRLKISRSELALDASDTEEDKDIFSTKADEHRADARPKPPAPTDAELSPAWREEIAALNLRLESMRKVAEEYEQARQALTHLQEQATQGKPATPHSPQA